MQILHHGPDAVARANNLFLSTLAYQAPPLGKTGRKGIWLTLPICGKDGWRSIARAPLGPVADLLDLVLQQSGYVDSLRVWHG